MYKLFLSAQIELITTPNGVQYDLQDFLFFTGLTREEAISLVTEDNIEHDGHGHGYDDEPVIGQEVADFWEELIEDQYITNHN